MNLHEACYQGAVDVVAELLSNGADPNAPADPTLREWVSCAGATPKPLNCVAIAWTMTEKHVEIARLLLEHGATVDDSVLRDHAIEKVYGNPADLALDRLLASHRADSTRASDSRVTLHMAASLDGFIARTDGRVDWLETADEFVEGASLEPIEVEAFLRTIDCYVMGSRTYETALRFEAQGLGWVYGDKPTFVLTTRTLPRHRQNVEFFAGDLERLVNERLRPAYRSIWFAGGGAVAAECLRLGLADEVRYSILPVLIGDGIPFFAKRDGDVALHLAEVKAYKNGMVELRYDVRGRRQQVRP